MHCRFCSCYHGRNFQCINSISVVPECSNFRFYTSCQRVCFLPCYFFYLFVNASHIFDMQFFNLCKFLIMPLISCLLLLIFLFNIIYSVPFLALSIVSLSRISPVIHSIFLFLLRWLLLLLWVLPLTCLLSIPDLLQSSIIKVDISLNKSTNQPKFHICS